jgi:hypothetical protein
MLYDCFPYKIYKFFIDLQKMRVLNIQQDKLFQFRKEIGFLKNQIHLNINNSKQINLHCKKKINSK